MDSPPAMSAVITGSVIAITLGTMLCWEHGRALRPRVERGLRHLLRNLTVGAFALAVGTLIQAPLLVPLTRFTVTHRLGVLNYFPLSRGIHIPLSILLLDYTLWIWHWATHRVPFLWRFHLVHHIDLDLQSSTALRFHFGEHLLSIFYRAAQIVVIGVTPLEIWVWQMILFVSILFHHANIELPLVWERRLVRVFVTPRMHGIHHSDYLNETNSNWSSLLSWWDYLHRTILLNVPQTQVRIGVPAYQRPGDVTIGKILVLPFGRQRADWQRTDGMPAIREHDSEARLELAP